MYVVIFLIKDQLTGDNMMAFSQSPRTEIPTSWYMDPDIYNLEQKMLFQEGPYYVGHELMVPHLNDYYVLHDDSEILIHNKKGIELVSNICRHHQALMLKGRGNANKIICPIHRWSYTNEGALLKAPHFPQELCLNLPVRRLKKWNGLLFSSNVDIAALLANLSCRSAIEFSDYSYSNSTTKTYDFNWKIFIDNYLDDYHVKPFHPGLGSLVDCNRISWEFGDNYSVQRLGVQKNLLKSKSEHFKHWHKALLDYRQGVLPEYGAIWFLLYPATMIEHYPEMITISTVKPIGPNQCINTVDYFYPNKILDYYSDLVRISQLAYEETALEDEEICHRIFNGRKLLMQNGQDDMGPYEPLSEEGIPYFHNYLIRNMPR